MMQRVIAARRIMWRLASQLPDVELTVTLPSWCSRPWRMLAIMLLLSAITCGLLGYRYIQNRAAALAYVDSLGGRIHSAPSAWWPPPLLHSHPDWLKTAKIVVIDKNVPCDVRRLTPLHELSHLTVHDLDRKSIESLRRFSHLRLHVRSPDFTDADVKLLVGTSLSGLGLEQTLVTDAGVAELVQIPTLKSVTLDNTQITDASLAELKKLPHLTELGLNGTRVTDAGLRHLRGLPLKSVYVMGAPISDVGIAELATLPKLEQLALQGSRVTDASLKHLRALPLKVLLLPDTAISDAGMAELAAAPLERISLTGTSITPKGLSVLKSAHLQSAFLTMPPFTDADVSSLRARGIQVFEYRIGRRK